MDFILIGRIVVDFSSGLFMFVRVTSWIKYFEPFLRVFLRYLSKTSERILAMKSATLAISVIVVVLAVSARWSSKAVIQTTGESSLAKGLSINRMTDQSDLIAIGSCVDSKSVWAGRTLVTLTTIAVTETLKGTELSTITVALPGGIDANRKFPVAMSYPGAPQITPGEDVFLFLTADHQNAGNYHVTGFSQGKFSIVKDQVGEEFVTRDLTKTMLKDDNGVRRGSTDATSLSSLKAQVKAHLQQR